VPTTALVKRPLLCGAFAFATLTTNSEPAGACPGAGSIPGSTARAAEATTCLVNAERRKRGLVKLRADRNLAVAAGRHARDMVKRGYFSHKTPAGRTVGDRLRAAGFGKPGQGWRAGEALGWGTGSRATPAALLRAWLNSPAHRRLLLDRRFRKLGVGVASGAPSRGGAGATYALNLAVIRSR
jgi:uncharacterized protein YkwD